MFTKEEILHYKELDLYSRSLELVTRFFKEKTDKANSNYMNHLLRVSQDFNDINIKSMALMHDVLEDTPITKEDLCYVLTIGQKARFSNKAILPGEARAVADFAQNLSQNVQKRLTPVRRLLYQYIRHLG